MTGRAKGARRHQQNELVITLWQCQKARIEKGPCDSVPPDPFTWPTAEPLESRAPEAGPQAWTRLLLRLRYYLGETVLVKWSTLSGLQLRVMKWSRVFDQRDEQRLAIAAKCVHRPVPVDGRTGRRAFICDFSFPSLLLLLPECWVGHCIFFIVLATLEQGNLFAQ